MLQRARILLELFQLRRILRMIAIKCFKFFLKSYLSFESNHVGCNFKRYSSTVPIQRYRVINKENQRAINLQCYRKHWSSIVRYHSLANRQRWLSIEQFSNLVQAIACHQRKPTFLNFLKKNLKSKFDHFLVFKTNKKKGQMHA